MKRLIFLIIVIIFLLPICVLLFGNWPGLQKKVSISNSFSGTIQNKGFLTEKDIIFPQGLNFSKAMSGSEGLGKAALYYDYNPVSLSGTEWVATQKVNSASDYNTAIKAFTLFYNSKIHNNGWTNEQKVDSHTIQPLAATSTTGDIFGYLKYLNNKVQVIIFYYQKDSLNFPVNVQFRVFLSNVEDFAELAK